MHRRRFVTGAVAGTVGVVAGCMGAEEDDTTEDEPSETGDHREVRVEADDLTREADNRVVENGQVAIILQLRNIGTAPTYADVSLQMRDRNGEPLGSPYTRQNGPIDPDESVELRFEVEESDDEIGGYELVVRETELSEDTNS